MGGHVVAEEQTKKRELRLLKNRLVCIINAIVLVCCITCVISPAALSHMPQLSTCDCINLIANVFSLSRSRPRDVALLILCATTQPTRTRREAAKECRRKKKEYIKCLENRVAVLENQNKALIDELKSLKELYCQKPSNTQN